MHKKRWPCEEEEALPSAGSSERLLRLMEERDAVFAGFSTGFAAGGLRKSQTWYDVSGVMRPDGEREAPRGQRHKLYAQREKGESL